MTGTERTLSRRGLFAAGGGALVGATGGYLLGREVSGEPDTVLIAQAKEPTTATTVEPFHGRHQAGVETTPQTLTTFLGVDLIKATADSARGALALLTEDAERLTRGEPSLADSQPDLAGIPARLTVAVGVGHPLFAALGLPVPPFFPPIPRYETDAFEPRWTQTDLVLQVGTDDAVTMAHVVRTLRKTLAPLATVAWVQRGFRSDSAAMPGLVTGRNLMGQVDGTVNPTPYTADFDRVVWIDAGPDWAVGGTVLVLRRIRMLLDTWDKLDRSAMELMIGRRMDTGAPLTGTQESDVPDFDAVDDLGLPVIPAESHIAVAHAASVEEMILRRPYHYDDGYVGDTPDVGLLFAAYTKDPRRSYIPMQQRIADRDAFNTWNVTVGSATYVYPRGAQDGELLGAGLFG